MTQNIIYKMEAALVLTAIIASGIGIYYLGPSVIGFIIKEFNYEENLNLVVTASGNYTWQLANIGDLKSVKLEGRMTNYGKARVYLVSNDAKYLVFDSTRLLEGNATAISSNGTILITGFAVKEDKNTTSDEDKKTKNKKPSWSGTNEFIINGTTEINLSRHFTDDGGDSLIYSVSQAEGLDVSIDNELVTITPKLDIDFNVTITFIASDGIDSKSHVADLIVLAGIAPILNETIFTETINQTQVLNEINQTLNITLPANETNQTILNQTKTITIDLAYKSGTIYDANDNGEESVNGVVDLTVENTAFGWDADASKLCTRWEVYSIEDSRLTTFCNGNNECCAFVSLLPSGGNWDNVYYFTFGKDNSGHNNIISAQVLYYYVNLSADNLKSEIYNSEWSNLSVKFFEEETQFSNVCLETCSLNGLNRSSYALLFEIEDDAVLRIDRIKYSVLIDVKNNAPLLLKNLSAANISENKNETINLSEYFSDPDGDPLTYSYYKADNITMLFENNIATIVADKGIEGMRFTYITANDSENAAASNIFPVNIVQEQKIDFFEIRDKNNKRLAVFDSLGSLSIRGNLTQNTEPLADENDFVIKNPDGMPTLVITSPEGNMLIKGSLNEKQSAINPTKNSFIIQNKKDEYVAYANSTGSLFLAGTFAEQVLFE
ncbi:hypothetical protein HYX04_02670 [Candidatus Woesearchaeota archaeon]|nr:hypothetical protein [Candidatus Woesearchaeota archaeon]